MRLPSTRLFDAALLVPLPKFTPPSLPEITFRAAGVVPPMTLLLEKTRIPSARLSAAATALSLADGILVFSSNNVIGGTTPAARNVISGNDGGVNFGSGTSNAASNNRVEGNLIGTNAAGTAAVGNSYAGVAVVSPGVANVIGGTTAAARNIISGNALIGVHLFEGSLSSAGTNLVQGNYIGVDVTGTAALPNGKEGVAVPVT